MRAVIAACAALALAGCHTKPMVGNEATPQGTRQVCSSCHGQDGRSGNPSFPNLAGQQQGYLKNQLTAFHTQTRADPHAKTYMWGMAATLDAATIDEISSFYSVQKPAAAALGDPALVAEGRKIYRTGIAASHVPPCFVCHGAHAQGAGTIPRLASQYPGYITAQLQAFQQNTRDNATMHMNARGLNGAEMQAVAAYLASLP